MAPSPPRPEFLRGIGKRVVFAAFRWTGVNAISRHHHRHALPILCYHNVVREPVPPWMAMGGLHLPEEKFSRQMEYLAARHRVLDLELAWQMLVAGDSLPRNAVALTFDDGYFGTIGVAAPILQRLRLPATVFLATDYVEDGGWYWWDELAAVVSSALGRTFDIGDWGTLDLRTTSGVRRALTLGAQALRAAPIVVRRRYFDALWSSAGVSASPVPAAFRPLRWSEAATAPEVVRFGAHGAGHRVVDLLEGSEVLEDTRRCKAALDRHLVNRSGTAYCYPEGRAGAHAPACIRNAGFTLAVTASSSPALERMATRSSDPLRLPRIGVSAAMSFDAFLSGLSGARSLLRIA